MHFVIAGKINCPQFVYATMIAEKLQESLPEFTYRRIAMTEDDWEKWLLRICRENEWYHVQSPIIWKEIVYKNGKKTLVGDVTKFLDICQDIYGLPRHVLTGDHLEKSDMEWFTKKMESEYFEEVQMQAKKHLSYRCRQVCILGAGGYAVDVLVMELLQNPMQNRTHGMEIRLFDEQRREKRMKNTAKDGKFCLGYSGLGSVRVVKTLRDALYNIDLVIVMDCFARKQDETLVKWLKRNRNAMAVLGRALNKFAKKHTRVVIGSPSTQPICYNATVLASFATNLHVRNIVVVTQDLGREALKHISEKTKVDLKDLHCPPVWGFIGLNKFIDMRRTLQKHTYRVPSQRLNSRISKGTEELEIRTIEPFISDEDYREIIIRIEKRKHETVPLLGRYPQLAKVTAILDLLKVWGIAQEDGNGEILSLGVYSDGTFNIPKGLYWSQPVTLEKGFWKPFDKYPIPRKLDVNIESFFTLAVAAVERTKVQMRIYDEPSRKIAKPTKTKFNMEYLSRGLRVPVVKRASDCVNVLNSLAKAHFGLDFYSTELNTIPEESIEATIEEVPKEKIYCECWKRELMELKKMAISAKSSTTEMEVDLSTNASGSEFSIINPTEPFNTESVSLAMIVPETTSSGTVVCDCGEECHCVDKKEVDPIKSTTVPAQSSNTQSSYPEKKTVQSHEPSLEGTEPEKKNVSFDPNLDPCAGRSKFKVKFYGTQDRIGEDDRKKALQKRIKRYEKGESFGETSSSEESSKSTICDDYLSEKFQYQLDDNLELVGDPDGLEALEEIRRNTGKDSADDFSDMWVDAVMPGLQIYSSDSLSQATFGSEEGARSQVSEPLSPELSSLTEVPGEFVLGEEAEVYPTQLDVIPEGENEDEEALSDVTLMEEDAVKLPPIPVQKVQPELSAQEPELPQPSEEPRPKTYKREGIPRCCFCHCIIPEGVLGCSCGETKVMEVFVKGWKGESEMVDEEYTIIVEEDKAESTESKPSAGKKEWKRPIEDEEEENKERKDEEEADEGGPMVDIFSLPPESFFPFSPKPVNKFTCSVRPPELIVKDSKDSLSPSYYEVMMQLNETREEEESEQQPKPSETLCRGDCELNEEQMEERKFWKATLLINPDQYWKNVLMEKYVSWFYTSISFRDEMYYEMAVEEVSDDEIETDNPLKEYFEN